MILQVITKPFQFLNIIAPVFPDFYIQFKKDVFFEKCFDILTC